MRRSSSGMLALAAIGMGHAVAAALGGAIPIATPDIPPPPPMQRFVNRPTRRRAKTKRALSKGEAKVAGQAGLGPHPKHWPRSRRPTGAALAQAIKEWETARDLTAQTKGW